MHGSGGVGSPFSPCASPPSAPPQVLEYVGKGKSIVDVGLAQARRPLSPRSHYFELEILDPGEKCYIALGVARKVRGGLGIGVGGTAVDGDIYRTGGMWVKNGDLGVTEGVKGGWEGARIWDTGLDLSTGLEGGGGCHK